MRGQGQGQGRARLEVHYLAEEAAHRGQESCSSHSSAPLRPALAAPHTIGHTWSQDRDSSDLTLPHCQDNIKLNLK